MKRIVIFFIAINSSLSAYSQTKIQEGDRCFDTSDYTCAVTVYNDVFVNATGKGKQIAEIKLTRAKWCAKHIKVANQAFAASSYTVAKEEYQKVLDSNPKDSYAQSQIVKCDNTPKLRKATTDDIADIWSNKYGVNPQRRKNLINAGIDPDDAQKHINAGEGKPVKNKKTSLSVSKKSLYFNSLGQIKEQIKVNTSASAYSVRYVPSWCIVEKFNSYFIVSASTNPKYTDRKDWFKVVAGDKEVRINIVQYAKTGSSPSLTSNTVNCFNCPKTNDTWGVTFGYTQQKIDLKPMDVYTLGLKIEPLFYNGFGLNTGVNLLGYMNNLPDPKTTAEGFYAFAINAYTSTVPFFSSPSTSLWSVYSANIHPTNTIHPLSHSF